MTRAVQRLVGALALLAAGVSSLPVAAYFLDAPGMENWIVVVQLAAMVLIGAGITVALPALARAGAPTRRRALTGAWWGLLAAFVGVLIFWLLLNGLGGA